MLTFKPESFNDPFAIFPEAVSLYLIQNNFQSSELTLPSLVSKKWHFLFNSVVSKVKTLIEIQLDCFGSKEWKQLFNEEVPEIPWPKYLLEISKRITFKAQLLLVPAEIAKRPFSLRNLFHFIGQKEIFFLQDKNILNHFGDFKIKKSYWVLISKEILWKDQPLSNQIKNLTDVKSNLDSWTRPYFIEALLFQFIQWKRSGKIPFGFSLCKEKIKNQSLNAVGFSSLYIKLLDYCVFQKNEVGIQPTLHFHEPTFEKEKPSSCQIL